MIIELAEAAAEVAPQESNLDTYLPAAIGFLGVLVGGMVTLLGQHFTRKSARHDAISDSVVQLVSSTHIMETNMQAWSNHLKGETKAPYEVFQQYIEDANNARDIAEKQANLLSIQASDFVRASSIRLHNSMIDAGNYVHPDLGDGKKDSFKEANLYLDRVAKHRRYLTEVARTPTYRRWVKAIQNNLDRKKNEASFQERVAAISSTTDRAKAS